MAPSKLVFKYVKATGLGSFQKDALKTSSKSRVSIHGEPILSCGLLVCLNQKVE